MMKPTISIEEWYKRIRAARQRRERLEGTWNKYAILHTNAYQATADRNDDESVVLPNGDQVKLGLVHRNIEQTIAILEIPEITLDAKVKDYNRELGIEDSHREAVVETALENSMERSGFLSGAEVIDMEKRDGVIVGHAINYTYYRMIEDEVEVQVPVAERKTVQFGAGGVPQEILIPKLDDNGEQVFDVQKEKKVIYEAVQDEYVSPLEFIFDSEALTIYGSRWQGRERIIPLSVLKSDPRYKIPDGIEGSAYRRKDLYGQSASSEDVVSRDSVRSIEIWDKENRELISFIEANPTDLQVSSIEQPGGIFNFWRPIKKTISKLSQKEQLYVTRLENKWPVRFDNPDDSPFSVFIPIPANDYPFGISQIEHIKNPALEADKIRTRMANLTRQIKRLFLSRAGKLDEDNFNKALQSPDSSFLSIHVNDDDDFPLDRYVSQFQTPGIPAEFPAMLDMSKNDVDGTSGISNVPNGGADTATEASIIASVGNARPNRKRRLLFKHIADVAQKHKSFLEAFAPDSIPLTAIAADGSEIRLEYGRKIFEGYYSLRAHAADANQSPARQKVLFDLSAGLSGKYGPRFDKILFRNLFTELGIRRINDLIAAIPDGQPTSPGAVSSDNPENYTDPQALREGVNVVAES